MRVFIDDRHRMQRGGKFLLVKELDLCQQRIGNLALFAVHPQRKVNMIQQREIERIFKGSMQIFFLPDE